MDELARLDATETASLIRSGELTASEVISAAIERVEKLNPKINAVINPLFDPARSAARSTAGSTAGDPQLADGPFWGVPFLLKDLTVETAGDPYYCGTSFLKDLNWLSTQDTSLAKMFREAGLVAIGKTNTPEFGTVVTTEPATFGPTRNPWNLDHSVGGSSGGSAAAVASGMVPAAHANDGGGSIRIPASECGLVGLKPTRGRVTHGPVLTEEWNGFAIDGCVTRTVRDTAGILDAISGMWPGDPYGAPPPTRRYVEEVGNDPGCLRVGVMTENAALGITAHPDCIAAVETTLRTLESLGHIIDLDARPSVDDPEFAHNFLIVVSACTARLLAYWSETIQQEISLDALEPHNKILIESGRSQSALQYLTATEWLGTFSRRVATWWADGWDLLVTPTIAEPPPKIGEFDPTPDNPGQALLRSASLIPFTPPFNVTGQPAISLPLHWNDSGLPIGVQLVAAYGKEDLLIRVASQLERALPWRDRIPPIHT